MPNTAPAMSGPKGSADYLASPPRGPLWRGCNVTMPHKQAVMPLLDHIDRRRDSIGAVNTVLRVRSMRAEPAPTPMQAGFSSRCADLAATHYFRMARIIGTGGAARAIITALADKASRWWSPAAIRPRPGPCSMNLRPRASITPSISPTSPIRPISPSTTARAARSGDQRLLARDAGPAPLALRLEPCTARGASPMTSSRPRSTRRSCKARGQGPPHHRWPCHADRAGGGRLRAVLRRRPPREHDDRTAENLTQ
jgi:hypothetical protein